MWEKETRACLAAAEIGASVLQGWIGRVRPSEKGTRDFVTEADLASQQAIFDSLAEQFPSHQLIGEEGSSTGDLTSLDSGPCWLVDPLDGTTNYLHQFPSYCVSIALVVGGRPVVGVVRDPMLGQTYHASDGGGAFRNGQPIRCSRCESLPQALVAGSLPPDLPHPSRNLGEFVQILRTARSMRRLGSCALNLCYVADGRLDAYWADTVRAWDVAAGAVIAQEAGAFLMHRAGDGFRIADPRFIAAATPVLARALLAELDRAVPV